MQKKYTDSLYIVGLYIVTEFDYEFNSKEGRFLKWIVVENLSDDYTTEFEDIKTKTKYHKEGFDLGELYVDLNTIVSMNKFTNKNKLGIEEINIIKEQFEREHQKDKEARKMMNVICKACKSMISEIGKEKAQEIINDIVDDMDMQPMKTEELFKKAENGLDIKGNTRRRNK